MRAFSFASVFFSIKENEDDKTDLACKIRVTCSMTENERVSDFSQVLIKIPATAG